MISVLYLDINTYGSLPAFFVGLILRLGGGEPSFDMEPFISYPGGKKFPFRSFSALMALLTLLSISRLAKYLFKNRYIPAQYDIFDCKLAEGGRFVFFKQNFVNFIRKSSMHFSSLSKYLAKFLVLPEANSN